MTEKEHEGHFNSAFSVDTSVDSVCVRVCVGDKEAKRCVAAYLLYMLFLKA